MTCPHPRPPAEWRLSAACRDADPEAFFPDLEGLDRVKPIIAQYCRHCPVATECLEAALQQGYLDGIFGGLTPDERRVLNGALNTP
ncbi:MAG: WhiB family transcriptional regulator [Actinomycetota bacterium]|nr:WhiB family transcriptional regulator [Actinomycetota bacterium]